MTVVWQRPHDNVMGIGHDLVVLGTLLGTGWAFRIFVFSYRVIVFLHHDLEFHHLFKWTSVSVNTLLCLIIRDMAFSTSRERSNALVS